ncbi:hypothetical protein [Variovorax soli]|nr:hypothetical protein [Variovorax soli]
MDQQVNLLASYSAQLRDGNGFTTGIGYVAQCRLVKSGSILVLQRYNGVGLTINGVTYAIPSAGVSLAPTSLTPGTAYNIYAYMNAGTMTLEASTTAHATDSTTGIEIKSGDATRTLVGKAQPVAGPAWSDSINSRLVISYYNRRPIFCQAGLGGNISNSSTSAAELSTTLQNVFLTWGDAASFSFDGYASNSTAGAVCRSGLSLDGTSLLEAFNIAQDPGAGNVLMPVSVTGVFNTTEGGHYVTAYVSVSAGTGTWGGTGTTGARCSVKGVIQG